MAPKELWVYLLGYNLICLLMAQAALLADRIPRQLSCKHMGLNPTQLKPSADEPGVFTGGGESGVCTTGEMTWRTTVTVMASTGPVQSRFGFRAR